MNQRWITKNGIHIPIRSGRPVVIRESDLKKSITNLHAQNVSKRNVISRSLLRKKTKLKPQKKWYQKGWSKEIYKFQESNYAIDIKNFGDNNFSFSVRKGNKEIFTVPRSLLKNAVSCGFSLVGIPECPIDLPLEGIEQTIKLYQHFTN